MFVLVMLSNFDYVTNNYKNVKILKNENKGFGQGNNIGFIASRGEFILFLNPDTILIEPIFSFAINCFESEPKLGLFGLKLINMSIAFHLSHLCGEMSQLLRSFEPPSANKKAI